MKLLKETTTNCIYRLFPLFPMLKKINVRIYAAKPIKEVSFVSSFGRYKVKFGENETNIQKNRYN